MTIKKIIIIREKDGTEGKNGSIDERFHCFVSSISQHLFSTIKLKGTERTRVGEIGRRRHGRELGSQPRGKPDPVWMSEDHFGTCKAGFEQQLRALACWPFD